MRASWACRRRGCVAAGVGLLLLLPLAAGCSDPQGTVSGRVLLGDKPVPGGWVTFLPADPRKSPVHALIDDKGNYEATLPAGEVKIAVDNREWQPPDRSGPGPALPPGINLPPGVVAGGESRKPAPASDEAPAKRPGSYIPLPTKYYEMETSGLSYTVKPGAQSHDIELK
jgi:hypothetical protein